MTLIFTKTVKDSFGEQMDVDVVSYGNDLQVELDKRSEYDLGFRITELDKLIKTLQEAKDVLYRGRNTD